MWHSTGPSRPVNYWKHANGDGCVCSLQGWLRERLMGALRPLFRRYGVERALCPCRSFACSRSATTAEKAHWACRPRSSHPHSRDEVTPTSRTALVFDAFFFGWLRSLRYSRSIKDVVLPTKQKRRRWPPLASPRLHVSYAFMPYLSFYQIGLCTRTWDVNVVTMP